MRVMLVTSIAVVSIGLVDSVAHAGDQGDPDKSCDGNTFEMVECLKARTAQWDKRMMVAGAMAIGRSAIALIPSTAACQPMPAAKGPFDADPYLLRLRHLVPRCSHAAFALPDLRR